MTRTFILRMVGGLSLSLLLCGAASAQYNPYPSLSPGTRFAPYARQPQINPSSGPRLSPYLNLLRGGNPAANYFMGVVPEVERRRFESQTIASFQSLEERTATPPAAGGEDNLFPKLSQTGHPVQYMNAAPYYNMGNSRGTGQQPQGFQAQARPKR
jgi:hypothetical protein